MSRSTGFSGIIVEMKMTRMNPLNSIRWKLALTYAGIALLTALALGAALLLPLRGYYQEREREYLSRNAKTIALAVAPLLESKEVPPLELEQHIRMLSVLSQTRVVVMDANKRSLTDTQPFASKPVMVVRSEPFQFPLGIGLDERVSAPAGPAAPEGPEAGGQGALVGVPPPDAGVVVSFTASTKPTGSEDVFFQSDKLQFIYGAKTRMVQGEVTQAEPGPRTLISVVPVTNTLFGFELQPDMALRQERSNQFILQPVIGVDQKAIGWVQLSDGPAYGWEIVNSVAWAWLLASLVAVLLAGTVGWWISRRMSAPLVALTAVTRRMADGDLSVRASLQQEDEFGSLGHSFNEMAERIERTVQALSRFAADAAHELHTPLTALRTNLELAAGETRQASGYLERANEQLARMEHLTRDLLDLSRLESGLTETERELINLGDLLLQTCEPLASQAEQAGVAFDVDLPTQAAWVSGQRIQLQRMLSNLVENALKFTSPGGQVRVRLGGEDEQVRVDVEDSGIGIHPEDIPYLFNRFHRGRNAAGYPGSGLGLSIVRAIVEQHAGRVWAESTEGRTCFSLVLPRSSPAD